jgi:uncharacterized protein with FMN-binding domain
MRTRAVAGGVVASAAILTLGWQIGSAQVTASHVATAPATGSTGSGSSGSSGSGSAASPSPSASGMTGSSGTGSSGTGSSGSTKAKSSVNGTFDGTTAETQYGPMQVAIVVSAGKITDVKALQLTDEGGRSAEISNYAAPILRTETLSAQSASIQSVSGATFTSQGYISSLQSALDKAGL